MRICSIEGCGKKHKAHGFCEKHSDRYKKYGNPLAGPTAHGEPLRWLKSHTGHDGEDCLIWPYSRNKRGYALVRYNSRTYTAHRLMCEIVNGPPPAGKNESAHSCGNGHLGCVNPRHLRWASRVENQSDRLAHGTKSMGETHGACKLKESEVWEIIALKGKMTTRKVAEIFGVENSIVSRIQNRKLWRHLHDE